MAGDHTLSTPIQFSTFSGRLIFVPSSDSKVSSHSFPHRCFDQITILHHVLIPVLRRLRSESSPLSFFYLLHLVSLRACVPVKANPFLRLLLFSLCCVYQYTLSKKWNVFVVNSLLTRQCIKFLALCSFNLNLSPTIVWSESASALQGHDLLHAPVNQRFGTRYNRFICSVHRQTISMCSFAWHHAVPLSLPLWVRLSANWIKRSPL